ncbi:hypothetical protein [Actinomadura sp. K4S16]|uniref:hypothetical protein n=1 Tax=Actinomadura sp. K4S16 TaxID=1316147 RepID=UPI0011EF1FA2|nr:hypothetical protein [Actinomadura sp. K4S16]
MSAYLRLEGARLYLDVSLITLMLMYFVRGNSAKDPGRAETLMLLTVTMAAFGAMDALLNSGSGVAEDKSLGWFAPAPADVAADARRCRARSCRVDGWRCLRVLAIQLVGALVNHVRHTPAEWAGVVAALLATVRVAGLPPRACARIADGTNRTRGAPRGGGVRYELVGIRGMARSDLCSGSSVGDAGMN